MTSWPSISLARPLATLVGHRIVVLGTDADGNSRQLLLEVRSEKAGKTRLWWCLRPPRDGFDVPKSHSAVCDAEQTLEAWARATASIEPMAAAREVPISWGSRDWPRAMGSGFRGAGLVLAGLLLRWEALVVVATLSVLGALMLWEDPILVRELLAELWWVAWLIGALAVLIAGVAWLASTANGVRIREADRTLISSEIEERVGVLQPADMPTAPDAWSVVSPDTPLSMLAGAAILIWPGESDEQGPVILEVCWLTPWDSKQPIVAVTFAPLGSTAKPRTINSSAKTRLNDFCDRRLRHGAAHVLVVPEPEWCTGRRQHAVTRLPRDDDPTLSYEPEELAVRVLAVSRAGDAPVAAPPAAAQARVDAVKAEYGELACDIAYRIENSALFDDSEPLTNEFRLLLMRWDDESGHAAPSVLERLAMEVRLAFDTARNNAEALGFTHLPRTARARAVRAAKAAELALHATTDGERQAASSQLSRILSQLSLHYLPTSGDVPRMVGETHPQLDVKQ